MSRVDIDMRGLNMLARDVRRQLRRGGNAGPVRSWTRQMGSRYLGFTRKRYRRYSRGGGDWRSLAESTQNRRRSARTGRAAASLVNRRATGGRGAILIDTGTLIGALTKGAPGNVFADIRGGVRVGFGRRRHPEGKATLADIAHFHQTGAGNLPKREILVMPPDLQTVTGMMNDGRRAIGRMMRKHDMRRLGR